MWLPGTLRQKIIFSRCNNSKTHFVRSCNTDNIWIDIRTVRSMVIEVALEMCFLLLVLLVFRGNRAIFGFCNDLLNSLNSVNFIQEKLNVQLISSHSSPITSNTRTLRWLNCAEHVWGKNCVLYYCLFCSPTISNENSKKCCNGVMKGNFLLFWDMMQDRKIYKSHSNDKRGQQLLLLSLHYNVENVSITGLTRLFGTLMSSILVLFYINSGQRHKRHLQVTNIN